MGKKKLSLGWLYDIIRDTLGKNIPNSNSNVNMCLERAPQSTIQKQVDNTIYMQINKDETFIIDFLMLRDTGETLKDREITFPINNQYICISGEDKNNYFDTYNLKEDGMSKDKLYYKVSTCDFRFWVKPEDYRRFISVMHHRQKLKEERKEQRLEINRINAINEPIYDDIDNDIYKCFIAHKSGMSEAIGTWDDFAKVEEKIADICKTNNGRYYKSTNKNARFAIIFSYVNRVHSSVEYLRQKGYKVTTFEKALEYFNLSHMWDIDTLIKMEQENKTFLRNEYLGL
jgi:hypothetical protein